MLHRPGFSASVTTLTTLAALQAPAHAGPTPEPDATAAQLGQSLLASYSGIAVEAGSISPIGAQRQNSRLLSFGVPLRPMAPGISLRGVQEIEFAFADIGAALFDSALFLSSRQCLEPGPTTAGLALAVPKAGDQAA